MKIFPVTRFGSTDPFDMVSAFDKMFDNYFNTYPSAAKSFTAENTVTTVPRANVLKKDNGYIIELAAPGFSRDEFIIDVENNTLSISVSTEDNKEYVDSIQMREYRYHNFSRSWTLPEGTGIDRIAANYEAGILYINVPVEGVKDTKRVITVE